MTKEELEKVDAFLEKTLRAMGQMNRNEQKGTWEMDSSVRDDLVYEGYWKIQPFIKKSLQDE